MLYVLLLIGSLGFAPALSALEVVQERNVTVIGGNSISDMPYGYHTDNLEAQTIKLIDHLDLTAYADKYFYSGYGLYDKHENNCDYIEFEHNEDIDTDFRDLFVYQGKTYGLSRYRTTFSECQALTASYQGVIAAPSSASINQRIYSDQYDSLDAWVGISRADCGSQWLNSRGITPRFNLLSDDACLPDRLHAYSRAGEYGWNYSDAEDHHYCPIEIDSEDYLRPIKVCAPWWEIETVFDTRDDNDSTGIDLRKYARIDIAKKIPLCTQWDREGLAEYNATINDETLWSETQCSEFYSIRASSTCVEDLHREICRVDECDGYVEDTCKLIDKVSSGVKDYTKGWISHDGEAMEVKVRDDIVTKVYKCPPPKPAAGYCQQTEYVEVFPVECPGSDCASYYDCVDSGNPDCSMYYCEKVWGTRDDAVINPDGSVDHLHVKCSNESFVDNYNFESLSKTERVCEEWATIEKTEEEMRYCTAESVPNKVSVPADITETDIYREDPQCVRVNNIDDARPASDLLVSFSAKETFKTLVERVNISDKNSTDLAIGNIIFSGTDETPTSTGDTTWDENAADFNGTLADGVDLGDYFNHVDGFIMGSTSKVRAYSETLMTYEGYRTDATSTQEDFRFFSRDWYTNRVLVFDDGNTTLGSIVWGEDDKVISMAEAVFLSERYSWKPPSSNWSILDGGATLEHIGSSLSSSTVDNRQYALAPNNEQFCPNASGMLIVEATVNYTANGDSGDFGLVIARQTDPSDPNSILQQYRVRYDVQGGALILERADSSSETTLSSSSVSLTADQDHLMRAEASVTGIKVYIDGALQVNYLGTVDPCGTIGYTDMAQREVFFKNLTLGDWQLGDPLHVVEDTTYSCSDAASYYLNGAAVTRPPYDYDAALYDTVGLTADKSDDACLITASPIDDTDVWHVFKNSTGDGVILLSIMDMPLADCEARRDDLHSVTGFKTSSEIVAGKCVINFWSFPVEEPADLSGVSLDEQYKDGSFIYKQPGYGEILAIQSYTDGRFGYMSSYVLPYYQENNVAIEGREVFPIESIDDLAIRTPLDYNASHYQYTLTSKNEPSMQPEILSLLGLFPLGSPLTDIILSDFDSGSSDPWIIAIFGGKNRFARYVTHYDITKPLPNNYVENVYGYDQRIIKNDKLLYSEYDYDTGLQKKSNINDKMNSRYYGIKRFNLLWGAGFEETELDAIKHPNEWEEKIVIGWPNWPWYDTRTEKDRQRTVYSPPGQQISKIVNNAYVGATNQVNLFIPYIGDYELLALDEHMNILARGEVHKDWFIEGEGHHPYARINFALDPRFNLADGMMDGNTTEACRYSKMVEWGGGVSGVYHEYEDPDGLHCAKSVDEYVQSHSMHYLGVRPTNTQGYFIVKMVHPMPFANRVYVTTLGLLENREYVCYNPQECTP
ncbi:hypothetical protein ACXWTF_13130 [Thiomicrolovo sp. ZZH C-3]